MVKPHTSDTRMTYEYIRVTYGWHTSAYEWQKNDIRVCTSGIRMTHRYVRQKKNKLFKIFLIILFQNIRFVKEFLACNGCFGLFIKIKKGSEISFWCTFCALLFHTNAPYLILYQLTKFQCHIFFYFSRYQAKCIIN